MTCCLCWMGSHYWMEWPCLAPVKWDFPDLCYHHPWTARLFMPNMTRASVYGPYHGNDLATNSQYQNIPPLSNSKVNMSRSCWLIPYQEDELGPPKGLILLMAIVLENKPKVHSVMDYCELNEHVDMYMAGADVCVHKLREGWQGLDVAVLDLCPAYLQIHIERSLWPFQPMEIKGTKYCFTEI